VGSDLFDDEARAVIGVELYGLFDQLDDIITLNLLPWE